MSSFDGTRRAGRSGEGRGNGRTESMINALRAITGRTHV
jgi:hypothetical protein